MDLKRGLSFAMLDAIAQPFHPVLLGHVDWPDAPVFAHTGVGPIAFAGREWRGVGPYGAVDVPAEPLGGVVASEASLSLIGVPADLDGLADDVIRGRDVSLFLGVVAGRPGGVDGAQTSGPGNSLLGDPISLFAGTMDGLDLTATAQDGAVLHEARVAVATGPSARAMAAISHSDEDQRRRYPDDSAGRLVILAYARAQKLTWPAT